MLIILVGKSLSGKTTIVKNMVDNYGYTSIIKTTSRPKRNGEVDGVDYHFISDEDFLQMIYDKEFVDYRQYNTKLGVWHYGISYDEFYKRDKDGKYVIILTPDEYKRFKKDDLLPSDSMCFYINVSESTISRRIGTRQLKEEQIRRLDADRKDFAGFEEIADRIIYNNLEPRRTVDEIIQKIERLYNDKDSHEEKLNKLQSYWENK